MAGERGVNINSTAPNQEYEYAEDRGAIYQGIFGQSGILDIAEKLECTKYSNNEVRIASGDFINQGYQIRIPFGETRAFEIENGTVGQKRHDLIVAEFERVSQLKDTHAFKVIKGISAAATPQDPELTQQDLNAGGTLRQEPLYRIVLDGIEIAAIERITDYIDMSDTKKLGGQLPEYYAKASAILPAQAKLITSYAPNISGQGATYAWDDGQNVYITFFVLFTPGGDGIPSGGIVANIQGIIPLPGRDIFSTCSIGRANNTWIQGNCAVTAQGEISVTSGDQALFSRALGQVVYTKKF